MPLGDLDASGRLFRVMRAVHPSQVRILKGLNADAQPIDAQRFPEGRLFIRHVIRVGFKCDLCRAVERVKGKDPVKYLLEIFLVKQGGCAATDV